MAIDWNSARSHLLINPAYSEDLQTRTRTTLEGLYPAHLWLSTSGSYDPKWVALSKEAFLTSASAVNRLLGTSLADIWCNPLPPFHVGGLSIHARAWLSQSPVVVYSQKWDPLAFHALLTTSSATLTSLVPTQLFDLVAAQLPAPPSLRAVFIGAGALPSHLYTQSSSLGWPLLPTFGMTECCSQVATSKTPQDPTLYLLDHWQAKVIDGLLTLKGPALFTAYAQFTSDNVKIWDPKEKGWWQTQDRVELNNGTLIPLGRAAQLIKIGGETVDLNALQVIFDSLNPPKDALLFAMPDCRLGHAIHLATLEPCPLLVASFNTQVLPFERIRATHLVSLIPRSLLGKPLISELIKVIAEK